MDPRKPMAIARAFREAQIEPADVPDVVATVVVAFAKELQKHNERDGDTIVLMTIDRILGHWQPIRSSEPETNCAVCLESSITEAAAVWIVARKEGKTEHLSVCELHAGPARDAAIKQGADVTIERIRR